MFIFDESCELETENISELLKFLLRKHEGDMNEFWISEKKETFPCLVVNTAGNIATLTFFPMERHPGHQCYLEKNLNEPPVAFRFGGVESDCFPATGVVPLSVAALAVHEFIQTMGRPVVISNWLEL